MDRQSSGRSLSRFAQFDIGYLLRTALVRLYLTFIGDKYLLHAGLRSVMDYFEVGRSSKHA